MTEDHNLEIISEKCFNDFLDLIHKETGITIAKNRKSMVLGRLRKRVVVLGQSNFESYYDFVKGSLEEKAHFIDVITTNETYFYRTPRIWSYIFEIYLPEWFIRNKGKTFFVWSAAASSGEEAYTLGMLLETFKSVNPGFTYSILGTDISRAMINCCKNGIYQEKSLKYLKENRPDIFPKYLKEVDPGKYAVNQNIKNNILFKQHNLFRGLNHPNKFDLVLLRNVLIYFTQQDQERVLSLVHPKLTTQGVLILGESESITHINTAFTSMAPFIYQKNSQPSPLSKATA